MVMSIKKAKTARLTTQEIVTFAELIRPNMIMIQFTNDKMPAPTIKPIITVHKPDNLPLAKKPIKAIRPNTKAVIPNDSTKMMGSNNQVKVDNNKPIIVT